jgi:hypothetical protein
MGINLEDLKMLIKCRCFQKYRKENKRWVGKNRGKKEIEVNK